MQGREVSGDWAQPGESEDLWQGTLLGSVVECAFDP